MELLSWSFAGDIIGRLESFEREITMYTVGSGETFSDAMRIGIILRQLEDSGLRQHLILQGERLKTYQSFRDELVNVRRAQLAVSGGSQPMDVGALSGGLRGGGGIKCNKCGKSGHKAADCWSGGGGGGGGKNGKKGPRGGGKASASDTRPKCNKCGKPGHKAADCWSDSGGGKASGGKAGRGGGGGKGGAKDKSGVKCHRCGKFGHYANKCPEKKSVNGLEEETAEPEKEAGSLEVAEVQAALGGLFINSLEIHDWNDMPELGESSEGDVPEGEEFEDDECSESEADIEPLELPGLEVGSEPESSETAEIGGLDVELDAVEKLTMGIDSGAAVTIIPRSVCTDYPLVSTAASRAGASYFAANGQRIADEGNREVFFTQGRGEKPRGMRAHVGDVRKGLICVAEMVDQGYEVHFGPNGHYAQRGADRVDFVRRNNVFEVEFEVVPYASTGTASMSGNGSRQGA